MGFHADCPFLFCCTILRSHSSEKLKSMIGIALKASHLNDDTKLAETKKPIWTEIGSYSKSPGSSVSDVAKEMGINSRLLEGNRMLTSARMYKAIAMW